jgi:hypothetical protein
MTVYSPDNWIVFKIKNDYRVLAGWSGSYLYGSSWKINSGVISVGEDDSYFYFYGSSGSCYMCHKQAYGLRMNTAGMWNQITNLHGDEVIMLDENTDWHSVHWGSK